ncbi:MAG TPA: hypothetical protein VK172_07685 [Lentimicrobium sp.]|nr:hypothetical protein [Lentimicrobium sp.]
MKSLIALFKRKTSIIVIVIYAISLITIKITFPFYNFISYDNFGYYMHIPARYIYNDVELKSGWFEQITEKYQNTGYFSQTVTTGDNNKFMRYYKGMSYIWTPPFFVAHIYAKLGGYEADGFSKPYQTSLILYGALFSILGIFFTRKILLHYFTEKVTTITLIIYFFGTSLFYFSSLGNDAPHVYLFTLFCMLLWFTIKWHETPNFKYLIPLSISLGLIIAVRPSDLFISLFPILWGVYNKETLIRKTHLLLHNKLQIVTGIVIIGVCIFPQLFYYYSSTGSFIVNIYNDPQAAFDFLHPRFLDVLIGFRKGWFIYSPLSILGFLGIVLVYKRFRIYFWPLVIYLSVIIYLIASFNSLVSMGWRAFLQSAAVLIIPTGFLVESVLHQKKLIKVSALLICSLFIILSIHQAFQIKNGVLDGSRMTREYYFAILGKNKVDESDKRLLRIDRPESSIDFLPSDRNFYYTPLDQYEFEDLISYDSASPKPYNGKGMYLLDSTVIYSPGFHKKYTEICSDYYCFIRISVYVYSDSTITDKLFLVTNTKNTKGENIKWSGVTIGQAGNSFKPGRWNKLVSYYLTPEIYSGNEIIEAYVWYSGKNKVWIDDLNIGAFHQADNEKSTHLNYVAQNDVNRLKNKINRDTVWIKRLKLKASYSDVSLDSLVTNEAIWCLSH